jgi:hypothetical protein
VRTWSVDAEAVTKPGLGDRPEAIDKSRLICTFLSWTISGIARQRAFDEKGAGFRLPKRLWLLASP